MEAFGEGEEAQAFKENPLFKFFENTEKLQAKLKMTSLQKMLHLYQTGLGEGNKIKDKKKQFPDIIKGLFKGELKVTLVVSNLVAFIAVYRYRNEAVLIRMLTGLKKYLRYFE